ncbi:signal peptidase II [Sporosalibacterium faouarense]|uniref:signal peptidase II n=1 Tax=Sporosalibacterium faouarense TaxID=516123 RepID=UPI00192AC7E0|nr:signal peptidase II [Sporosalibacterium faouarense]
MLYIIFLLIVALDQMTKYLAVEKLMGQSPFVIINNFLQFNYVENFGAAFGIMQNKQTFFIIITVIIFVAIIIFMKLNNNLNKIMKISLVMILAGAIGNLIDRIRLGYVVDFVDVKFGNVYDYPVFNIADSSIVVATLIIIYLVLTDKYELKGKE